MPFQANLTVPHQVGLEEVVHNCRAGKERNHRYSKSFWIRHRIDCSAVASFKPHVLSFLASCQILTMELGAKDGTLEVRLAVPYNETCLLEVQVVPSRVPPSPVGTSHMPELSAPELIN